MKKSVLTIVFSICLSMLFVGCSSNDISSSVPIGGVADTSSENRDKQLHSDNEKEEITTRIENFGRQLQKVSTLAPEDELIKSIKVNYKEFLTPTLFAKWLEEPQLALGRETSSPWPERIEIQSIEKSNNNMLEVSGNIIEISSVEKANGGIAGKRPIILTVKLSEGKWLIDHIKVGDYNQEDTLIYKNNEFGFTFTLPASWDGYDIVKEEWEGIHAENREISHTGPMLLIRHPNSTPDKLRQDIPIMIFTTQQWDDLMQERFHIGAAPVGPRELTRNEEYVFAIPARYNFAFPEGYEEVEKILDSNPLIPFSIPQHQKKDF